MNLMKHPLGRADGVLRPYVFYLFLAALLLYMAIPALSQNSPFYSFNVSSNQTAMNWTNGTLLLHSNLTGVNMFYVDNENTSIAAQYASVGSYGYLSDTQKDICFGVATRSRQSTNFRVQNLTGDETIYTKNLTENESALLYLLPYFYCPPGQYAGNFTIYNYTNRTEIFVNISAVINVPLSANNTYRAANKTAYIVGSFSGSSYHSYYFNNTLDAFGSSMAIAMSGLTADVDMFLFSENGTYLAGSINKNVESEEIYYTLPSDPQYLELRVYGNESSAYNINFYFSDLNITNSTMRNLTIEQMDLGPLNPNQTSSNIAFELRNDGLLNISNVTESVEVYYVKNWSGYSTNMEFDLFVPNFTQQLVVKVEWNNESNKNVTDWDIQLRDPSGALVGNSSVKYLLSNRTNAIRAEFAVSNTSLTDSNKGFWNISVINRSADVDLCVYNVTAYIYMNASRWLSSGFRNHTVFNASGAVNVTVNVTVPEREVVDGQYIALLTYGNGSGAKDRLRVSFNVKAGMMFLNGNFSGLLITNMRDNIGINRTYSETFAVVTINNTGRYFVNFTTEYTGTLNLTTNNSKYINISVEGPSNISANNYSTLTLNLTINTNTTQDTAGYYIGWILLSSQNATATQKNYPYETFNITVKFYLTNRLSSSVNYVEPTNIMNPWNSSNISFITTVRFINGSPISGVPSRMGLSNFSNFRMRHPNATSYSYAFTGRTAACSGSICNVTAEISPYYPGGLFNVTFNTTFEVSGKTLFEQVEYYPLYVNNSGLLMTEVSSTSQSVDETNVTYFNMTVVNLGTENAVGHINMSNCTYANIEALDLKSDCGSIGSTYFSVNINANSTERCWYRWKVTAASVSQNQNCLTSVRTNIPTFNNLTDISFTIENVGSGSTTTTTDTSSQNTGAATEKAVIQMSQYTRNIYIVQEETGVAIVYAKNAGNKTFTSSATAVLSDGDADVNITKSPETCKVAKNEVCDFRFSFFTSNNTAIGNYSGTFRVYSVNDTSVYEVKEFTLVAEASETKKTEINGTYQEFLALFGNVSRSFDALAASGVYDSGNLSIVEMLINSTKEILEQAKALMDAGEFATAQALLDVMQGKIDSINTAMKAMETKPAPQVSPGQIVTQAGQNLLPITVAIILIFAAVGLVIYMLLPPEGYHYKYGFTPGSQTKGPRGGIVQRIKSVFRRRHKEGPPASVKLPVSRIQAKEYKLSTYGKGAAYSKETGPAYNYSPGMFKSFLKRFRKGKRSAQRVLSEFGSQGLPRPGKF